jgi:hypothetical protein
MKYLKTNWFKILIVLLFCIFIIILSSNNDVKNKNSDVEVKKSFLGNDLSFATQITCTFPQVLGTYYSNNEILHTLPKPETNPIIDTFSDLDNPKVGKLSYIDSTQSISSVSVIKLVDNEEKIIYIEGSGENHITVFTIYKKSGVSTFIKTVDLFGIPSGSLAMGTCVGY